VCAHDFGDQGVSPQQTKFAANPGRVAAPLLFVVGSLGEEDGAEIAVAEAMDSELAESVASVVAKAIGLEPGSASADYS
jgi:hypothetical protein